MRTVSRIPAFLFVHYRCKSQAARSSIEALQKGGVFVILDFQRVLFRWINATLNFALQGLERFHFQALDAVLLPFPISP